MMPAETLQATVPAGAKDARTLALADPDSPAAQQYRVLHQRLLRIGARRPLRTIAVTSSGRREGRTTTAANLALAAAQEGRSTILVEADLRHPSLAAGLGLAPRAGLAEVIEGTAELGQAVTRLGPLEVLCDGAPAQPAGHGDRRAAPDRLRAGRARRAAGARVLGRRPAGGERRRGAPR